MTALAVEAAARLGDARSLKRFEREAVEYRRWVRRQASAPERAPVQIVDGARAPKVVGEGFSYRTLTGKIIRHPNAYAKCGWSSMVYHRSTIRVEVGARWLAARGVHPAQVIGSFQARVDGGAS